MRIERFCRQLIARIISVVFRVQKTDVTSIQPENILVIRLDERTGNLLMLTPLLRNLRARFPTSRIDLLAHSKGRSLLGQHTTLSQFVPFRKKAWLSWDGPLLVPLRLRRKRYDLVIDAGNPTDPSLTQVLLARIVAVKHSIGPACQHFAKLYTVPVTIKTHGHEIDLRLQLLQPLGVSTPDRHMQIDICEPAPVWLKPYVQFGVLNVGARLLGKQLSIAEYARLLHAMLAHIPVLVTYGPQEYALAQRISSAAHSSLAPPTNLTALAHVFAKARFVITCDTGPMHLAVALNTPTCGIFVSTPPERYGYDDPPHRAVDARQDTNWYEKAELWMAKFGARQIG
jgi:heptosyltransferase III